ncbi:hypothetical protein [Streptomyces sp. NBC_00448]|uniref:hypothetical protein n=1 Tax=Streptomyces sp. NBC_00448 TaxID=2903652 RepID=UPI002E20770C
MSRGANAALPGSRARSRARAVLLLTVAALACGAAPAVADGSPITVLDNSHSDSILEVDRTANVQTGHGDAGSDHDGSAVDALEVLFGGGHPGGDGDD